MGCQPVDTERFVEGLSPPVAAAVGHAASEVTRTPAGTYRLAESAIPEAGELFRREFDEMVNRSAHGAECSRPDCACHTLGPQACEGPLSTVPEP